MVFMEAELTKGLLVHTGLYSVYGVAFALSIWTHWQKKTTSLWIHLSTISALFVLATISYFAIVNDVLIQHEPLLYTRQYYERISLLPLAYMTNQGVFRPTIRVCYILSNLISDSYITWRCYVVWGCYKRIVILPILLLIGTLVCQIAPFYNTLTGAYFNILGSLILTFVTNLTMTALTAGRIWWMGHKASLVLNQRILSRYRRTIQILIESGSLYPITLLITLIMIATKTKNGRNCAVAANLCIVNIAPTLIVIRVGLGISARDVETTVQEFTAAQPPSYDHEEVDWQANTPHNYRSLRVSEEGEQRHLQSTPQHRNKGKTVRLAGTRPLLWSSHIGTICLLVLLVAVIAAAVAGGQAGRHLSRHTQSSSNSAGDGNVGGQDDTGGIEPAKTSPLASVAGGVSSSNPTQVLATSFSSTGLPPTANSVQPTDSPASAFTSLSISTTTAVPLPSEPPLAGSTDPFPFLTQTRTTVATNPPISTPTTRAPIRESDPFGVVLPTSVISVIPPTTTARPNTTSREDPFPFLSMTTVPLPTAPTTMSSQTTSTTTSRG